MKNAKLFGQIPGSAKASEEWSTGSGREAASGNKLRVDVGNKWFDLELDQYQASEESTLGNVFWRADGGCSGGRACHGRKRRYALCSQHQFPLGQRCEKQRTGIRQVANIRGMQLHKAKDWNGSAAQFRTAISADPDWSRLATTWPARSDR